MDRRFRKLEREWAATGSPVVFEQLLVELLRQRSHEEWERAAESGDQQALDYIAAIRRFIDEDLQQTEVYVNAYEDFTARSAVLCSLSQITEVRRWLRSYYVDHNLFYAGREVYDISLAQTVQDPAAQFVVETSVNPCFRMTPGEIKREADRLGADLGLGYEDDTVSSALLRRLCPINRWGQRERYVSLTLIDDIGDELQADESSTEMRSFRTDLQSHHAQVQVTNPQLVGLPHWVNVYQTTNQYGGPEEGGWYFYVHDPVAAIYVGELLAETSDELELSTLSIYQGAAGNIVRPAHAFPNAVIPSHVQPAVDFATQMYQDLTEGDMHSVLGGSYMSLQLQTHPAVREPFCRPYYC